MTLGRRPFAAILAVAAFGLSGEAASAALASPASDGSTLARPTDGGELAYASARVEQLATAGVVVHYVLSGPDAPPFNDDDGNGAPDYVEQVAAAADHALAVYARRGFAAPLPDAGGPDARPDVYVKALGTGLLGLAVPNESSTSGAFVLVSPRLDPHPQAALASLAVTVAHELFHLVQFAYERRSPVPRWAAEGAATAMAHWAFPDLVDPIASAQAGAWLEAPWESLAGAGRDCDRCYGSALWWLYLDRSSSDVLRLFLERAGSSPTRLADGGLAVLDRILRERRRSSLAATFHAFAVHAYRQRLSPTVAFGLGARLGAVTTAPVGIAPVATHYVRLTVPATARGLAVAVPAEGTRSAQVTLVLGGPGGRVVRAKPFRGGGGAVVSAAFRNAGERRSVLLVVTNGAAAPQAYRLSALALGSSGTLPGWIAWTRTG
jgi:hypothetical protein